MEYITETLGQVLEREVARHPDKEFMIYPDRDLRFTYAEFNRRVNRLAKGLLAIGLKKGDHLGIWATNVPDWLTFLFATAKIGVIAVTVNTAYRLHELEYLVKQSDIKALCLIDGFRDIDYVAIINELVPELKSCERGRLESTRFPRLKSVIFIGPEKHRGMYNTQELLLLGGHTSDEELAAGRGEPHLPRRHQHAVHLGHHGLPQGRDAHPPQHPEQRLPHRRAPELHRRRSALPARCRSSTASAWCSGSWRSYTHGATAVVLESFDPLLALASVQKERCTALYGVPTMFIAELNHPMFKLFNLSSLRTGIMAGSPCPMEIMKRVISDMRCRDITIAYGLTEGSPVMTQTSTDDPIEMRVSTVGQRLPGIEVRIVNPETNTEVPPGTQGEVVCRGYNVMKGYYQLPEATTQAIDADGWLHSGDLGTMDEKGYFKITGRIKDMIIRGGENISPREIEEFLLRMEGIRDIQVAGIASPKYGEEVGAFVIKKDGATITEEDVRDFCRGKIANFKIPKHVFFVNAYPMTASGKIQKYKLRELGVKLLQEGGVEPV